MKYVATFILMSFVGLLALGFTTMPHDTHHGKIDCVVSVLDKVFCGSALGSMAIHHINAYTSFLSVVFMVFVFLALTLSCLWLLYIFQSRLKPIPVYTNQEHPTPERRFLKWLSLFINSPTS